MQTKIFNQLGRSKRRKVNPITSLSFLLLSGLISFSLIGCSGGGGSSSTSGEPIDPALFSGWGMTNGPFSGIVSSLAVDPNNSQGVYAAVQSGGLFTSGDGGRSWTHVEGGLENLFILAVARDSQSIYIGTKGDGIYKTVNGGVSWSPVNNGLPNRFFEIDDLIIDPNNSSITYAILDTRYYLYKTTNGGNNWEEIGGGLPADQVRSFVIHPVDTQIVYVGTYQNGIFKSEDGGLTWTPINGNFPPYIAHISCIGIDPGNPTDPDDDIIYAGTHDYGFYKTIDDGNYNWEFIEIKISALDIDLPVEDNWSIYALTMDPIDKSTIYVYVETVNPIEPSEDGIYRTFDGGTTWERVSFHENYVIRDIMMAPSTGNVVYITTSSDGLFMTNDAINLTNANDWRPIDNGLVDTPVYTMILHSGDNKIVYAGTDEGFFKTTNGGLTWERKGLEGKSVFALASDPEVANTIYGATDTGVYKTIDGGESWSVISTGYQFNSLAVGKDPLPPNNNIIYGGNAFGMGIYRAEDDGSISWEEKNNGLTNDEKYVQCLAIDPSDPSILHAGTGDIRMPGPTTVGKIIKTQDGGDTWSEKLPINEPVWSLAIDPYNS
ncbi:MAG: WD40/YVTN/BNR-like repeat-containing protein, partial [Planctomycetota bacterium]